jgi:hypothetical protein
MKKALSALMILALIVLSAQVVLAQGSDAGTGPKPGVAVVDEISGTATVEAIDAPNFMVTLKLADGTVQTYAVDRAARNLDQVKVGDRVKATHVESVALYVRKSNEKPTAGQVRTVQLAAKGSKPGIIVTKTTEITARAEAIDYAKRTVSLKGPRGNTVTYGVDKSVKNFRNVKVGDELVLRVTDVMAIVVEKANQ